MNVHVSGPVLSSLFYEHGNSNRDLDGFLLGKVDSHIKSTISDTQMDTSTEVTNCYIYSHIVCTRLGSWHDTAGKIHVDELKKVLDDKKQKEVIGWFKFRRHSTMKPSYREQAIHCNLLDCFPEIIPKNFLFFLCTPQFCSMKSTHTMEHVLLVRSDGRFEALPMTVINLGDTVNSEYKITGSRTISNAQGTLSCMLGQLKPEFVANDGQMHSIIRMQTLSLACHHQLQDMCETVNASELQLKKLREDVRILKARLKPKPTPKPPSTEKLTDEGDKEATTSGTNPFHSMHRRSMPEPASPLNNPFSPDPYTANQASFGGSQFSDHSPVFERRQRDRGAYKSAAPTKTEPSAVVGDLIMLNDSDDDNQPLNEGMADDSRYSQAETQDVSSSTNNRGFDLMDCQEDLGARSPCVDLQGPEMHRPSGILKPDRPFDSDQSNHSGAKEQANQKPAGPFDFLSDIVSNQIPPQATEKTKKKRANRLSTTKVPSPTASKGDPSFHCEEGQQDHGEQRSYGLRPRRKKSTDNVLYLDSSDENEFQMDFQYTTNNVSQSDSPTY